METYKKFVLGFAFNKERTHVVLIRKNRPEWMAGLLNGVGGKLEENETLLDAMSREFYEETGVLTSSQNWLKYAEFTEFGRHLISCFKTVADIENATTKTDEEVILVSIDDLHKREDIISNVPWLVHMALTTNEPGLHPRFISMDFVG